jgi:hypothetical protein
VLTDDERDQLRRWARRGKSAQALALRSRNRVGCAEGLDNRPVAVREQVTRQTVGKWRGAIHRVSIGRPVRRAASGSAAVDHRRVGRGGDPGGPGVDPAQRDALVAGGDGRSQRAVQVEHRPDLEGVRDQAETFKLSNDPLFVDKVFDVVGLHANPPEGAVVLCVDEKSLCQALARSQPAFPMMPGMPPRRTHNYGIY